MNYKYTRFFGQGCFNLTDFNCASFDLRLGTGDFFKIIWARDEDVDLDIDGYHLKIKKNHVAFCTPFNMMHIKPYTKGVITYVFNKEFYCIRDHDSEVSCNGILFYGSSIVPIIELNEKEQENFELLFNLFEEEFGNEDHLHGEMLMILLKNILIKSVRLAKNSIYGIEIKQSKLDIIRQFNVLVEEHFRAKHKVADYAELLNKSPKSLSNLFSKYHNKSPLKVINERIILEAKRLLMFSNKKSEEIAFELGYFEISHFYKFFKKHTGLSPKAYKNQKH